MVSSKAVVNYVLGNPLSKLHQSTYNQTKVHKPYIKNVLVH